MTVTAHDTTAGDAPLQTARPEDLWELGSILDGCEGMRVRAFAPPRLHPYLLLKVPDVGRLKIYIGLAWYWWGEPDHSMIWPVSDKLRATQEIIAFVRALRTRLDTERGEA